MTENRAPVRKVVIIGPESTGKSTLTQALAKHYRTSFAAEYAREYLEKLAAPYTLSDLTRIAHGQIEAENSALSIAKNKLVFFDTDLQVIKVWSESKYNTCDPFILEQIAVREYDLYLLTDIDMAWEDDPLREHPEPEMRLHFFNVYKEIVTNAGIPFKIVSGDPNERLQNAIIVIEQLITTKN